MKRATLALLFVAGVWSGCSVFMWQVAIQNFAVAERLAVSGDEGLRDAEARVHALVGTISARLDADELDRALADPRVLRVEASCVARTDPAEAAPWAQRSPVASASIAASCQMASRSGCP